MTKSYKLVNPYIIGSMDTVINAESSLEAANKAYNNLSKYFGNTIPEFKFSLKRLSNDKKVIGGSKKSFIHFQVNESSTNNDKVNYEIKEIDSNVDITKFQEMLNKVANQDNRLSGGEHRREGREKRKFVPEDRDEELSDDFDFDLEKPRKGPLVYEPISYYWYDPYIYPIVDRLYVPTFVLPLQPRVVFSAESLLYLGRL